MCTFPIPIHSLLSHHRSSGMASTMIGTRGSQRILSIGQKSPCVSFCRPLNSPRLPSNARSPRQKQTHRYVAIQFSRGWIDLEYICSTCIQTLLSSSPLHEVCALCPSLDLIRFSRPRQRSCCRRIIDLPWLASPIRRLMVTRWLTYCKTNLQFFIHEQYFRLLCFSTVSPFYCFFVNYISYYFMIMFHTNVCIVVF